MSKRAIKIAQHEAAPLIAERKPFVAGNLSGRVGPASVSDAGRLSGPDRAMFMADRERIDYTVFSYTTPIAWHVNSGRWHVVTETFSVTTSTKHMPRLHLIRG